MKLIIIITIGILLGCTAGIKRNGDFETLWCVGMCIHNTAEGADQEIKSEEMSVIKDIIKKEDKPK